MRTYSDVLARQNGRKQSALGRAFPTAVKFAEPEIKEVDYKNTAAQMRWLYDHGLPVRTNLKALYAYVDAEVARLQEENKKKGKSFFQILPLEDIVKSYKYVLEQNESGKIGRIRRSPDPSFEASSTLLG